MDSKTYQEVITDALEGLFNTYKTGELYLIPTKLGWLYQIYLDRTKWEIKNSNNNWISATYKQIWYEDYQVCKAFEVLEELFKGLNTDEEQYKRTLEKIKIVKGDKVNNHKWEFVFLSTQTLNTFIVNLGTNTDLFRYPKVVRSRNLWEFLLKRK